MFSIFNNEYRCKLSTRALVQCEKILGDNPVNVLVSMGNEKLPQMDTLLTILWCSMQDMNHSIKKDDIYDIFDSYIENGGSLPKLMEFIVELFNNSGLINHDEPKSQDNGEQKN